MLFNLKREISFLLITIISLFFICCGNNAVSTETKANDSTSSDTGPGVLIGQRSFEVTTTGDTINIKDDNGLKQGIWITNTGVLLSNGGVKKDTTYYLDGQPQKKK